LPPAKPANNPTTDPEPDSKPANEVTTDFGACSTAASDDGERNWLVLAEGISRPHSKRIRMD
jgi:hypothetical protein